MIEDHRIIEKIKKLIIRSNCSEENKTKMANLLKELCTLTGISRNRR